MAKHVASQATDDTLLVTWELTEKDPDGEPFVLPPYRVATVQAAELVGGVDWYGSLSAEGDVWTLLHDVDGSEAVLTAFGMSTLRENVHRVQPRLRGKGTATVNVLVRRR